MRWLDGITDSMDTSSSKLLGDSERQGSLECCSAWSCKVKETCAGDLRELLRVPLRSQGYCGLGRGLSGLLWVWCNGRGPHLELRHALDSGVSPLLLNTDHFHLGITWFKRWGSSLRSRSQTFDPSRHPEEIPGLRQGIPGHPRANPRGRLRSPS